MVHKLNENIKNTSISLTSLAIFLNTPSDGFQNGLQPKTGMQRQSSIDAKVQFKRAFYTGLVKKTPFYCGFASM